MSLNPTAVLSEVTRLQAAITNARQTDQDFSKLHQEVLELCAIALSRKSQYGQIAIEYPQQLIFHSNLRGSQSTINGIPDIEEKLDSLSANLIAVLKRIRSLYSLRRKLEREETANMRTEIKRLAQRIAKIEKTISRHRKLRER